MTSVPELEQRALRALRAQAETSPGRDIEERVLSRLERSFATQSADSAKRQEAAGGSTASALSSSKLALGGMFLFGALVGAGARGALQPQPELPNASVAAAPAALPSSDIVQPPPPFLGVLDDSDLQDAVRTPVPRGAIAPPSHHAPILRLPELARPARAGEPKPALSAGPSSAPSSGPPLVTQERLEPSHLADLAEQQTLLDRARAALGQGDGDAVAALRLLAEHTQAYPRTLLAEERAALRVKALFLGGQGQRAKEELRTFERSFPRSPLLPSLRAAARASDGTHRVQSIPD